MHLFVHPIFSLTKWDREDSTFDVSQNLVVTKVREIVLERIGDTKSALLQSTIAPQIVTFLFPNVQSDKMGQRRKKRRKATLFRKPPTDLRIDDSEG